MSNDETSPVISWHDLTVPDADSVSNFYCEVAGWQKEALSMGDYSDYVMKDKNGNVAGGICNARGVNSGLPAHWLMYVTVDNLEASLEKCKKMGGRIMGEIRQMGEYGNFCLIQDPAGAYVMLNSK